MMIYNARESTINIGNKQFDYYEEVLTNVTWDQVQNVRTGENGEYTLEGFKPGRYIVRFTYGDVNEEAKKYITITFINC